jgi:hypothetical protein
MVGYPRIERGQSLRPERSALPLSQYPVVCKTRLMRPWIVSVVFYVAALVNVWLAIGAHWPWTWVFVALAVAEAAVATYAAAVERMIRRHLHPPSSNADPRS